MERPCRRANGTQGTGKPLNNFVASGWMLHQYKTTTKPFSFEQRHQGATTTNLFARFILMFVPCCSCSRR
jgi:hypothetical protein